MIESQITLQQGLENFHKKNNQYFSKRVYSEKGSTFLKNHDMAHVVFGCNTTIYGEGIVKIWTTFGTTLNFWEVTKGYNDVNAFELFKKYSLPHIMKNILRLLIAIPKVIYRTRRMKKKWPFTNNKNYLHIPIEEIRKEFNIQVL